MVRGNNLKAKSSGRTTGQDLASLKQASNLDILKKKLDNSREKLKVQSPLALLILHIAIAL